MPRVHVTGWRFGMEKVSTTETLRAHLALGLAEVKSITDRILEGGALTLDVETDEAAEALASDLHALGVEASAETARGLRAEAADPIGGG